MEEEGKGARGVCWGLGGWVGRVGWGAVHLRDGGMDGGVEDGERRKGKLPSVKKDKEKDIDRRIERKESE